MADTNIFIAERDLLRKKVATLEAALRRAIDAAEHRYVEDKSSCNACEWEWNNHQPQCWVPKAQAALATEKEAPHGR